MQKRLITLETAQNDAPNYSKNGKGVLKEISLQGGGARLVWLIKVPKEKAVL